MRSQEARDQQGELEIGVADRRLNQLLAEYRRSQASSAPTTADPGVRRVRVDQQGDVDYQEEIRAQAWTSVPC